jgi:hypothetical protein
LSQEEGDSQRFVRRGRRERGYVSGLGEIKIK